MNKLIIAFIGWLFIGAAGSQPMSIDGNVNVYGTASIANSQIQLKYGLLFSATIDVGNAAAQTVGTVPTGYTYLPVSVIMRNSQKPDIGTATGTFGFNAGTCTDWNNGSAIGFSTLDAATDYRVVFGTNKQNIGTSGTAFCFKTAVTEATAAVVTVDFYGYFL